MSQSDFILVRNRERKEVTDCEIVSIEPVVAQHRLLVMDLRTKTKVQKKVERDATIRLWELKGENVEKFRDGVKVKKSLYQVVGVELKWNEMKNVLTKAARRMIGRTKGKKSNRKETWWWNSEVQGALWRKKEAFKEWKRSRQGEAGLRYGQKSREVKRAIGKARWKAAGEWYENLETSEGEKSTGV